MAGKNQKVWLQRNIGAFLRQYTRKAQRGVEPNDRRYSRDMERELKQLSPEELNDVLYGDDEQPPQKARKSKPNAD